MTTQMFRPVYSAIEMATRLIRNPNIGCSNGWTSNIDRDASREARELAILGSATRTRQL